MSGVSTSRPLLACGLWIAYLMTGCDGTLNGGGAGERTALGWAPDPERPWCVCHTVHKDKCHCSQPPADPLEPDAGAASPDSGVPAPDTSAAEPDSGVSAPDTSAAEPDSGAPEPDGAPLPSSPCPSHALWCGGMEGGDMSEWYEDGGGGEYNSGSGVSSASPDVAHTGKWSAKMTLDGAGGARLFRWKETQSHDALYFSVWYYFPKQYQNTAGWWNVFQWKSKNASAIDPFFLLDALNRNGKSYLRLYEWQPGRQIGHQPLAQVDIPIGQWFQVEAFYKCAGDNSGKVMIWQDGVKLYDLSGVQTRFPDGVCQWSVNNYSGAVVTPSPTVIYVDDAAISTQRIGYPPGSPTP